MVFNRKTLAILCLFSLGFALLNAWEEIFFLNTHITYNVSFSSHQLYFASKGMALLLVIPLSNLFARFITKSGFYIVGAVMMLLSTSCLSSAILLDAPQLSLIVAIGDIAGAVAFGFYFLLWFSQCQWFQPMFVLGSFVAASFIAALPSSFCSSLTLNGVLIAGCIFGVMAVGLLYAGLRLLCNANHMKNLPKAESKEQSFPGMLWRIVVLMAAQRLVFAFNEGSLAVAVFGTGSNSQDNHKVSH